MRAMRPRRSEDVKTSSESNGAAASARLGFRHVETIRATMLAGMAIRAFRPELRLVFRACWMRSRKPRYAREQLVDFARATLADVTTRWTPSRRRGG